ncbi:MAG: Asp-tRNA(Asn)/Glu-tRNA(Gln) amidotransferase subunit GatA [Phycisphaerae bacterium]|nr:Asp-tRNA(Asn)/Glu-tRNA(Gln) amidotransferase subunit GatA [Phycisphaerae bacterium]
MATDADLLELHEHVAAVSSGRRSAEEGVRLVLDRIERLDRTLRCYHEVFAAEALAAGREIDRRVRSGEKVGPLAGACVAVKDNLATRLGRTTCSSRMLEHWRSPYEATCVERLVAADAIVIGKTNLDEFAMGSSGEHCAWGVIRNPWDPRRVPGGSSAGSAAAVAAGLCHVALGSDTGGSIRQPAAFCGCVGLKPSYGRVSRWGLVAFGSSLDQVGPIARSVRDASLVLEVIAGEDRRDATSARMPVERLGGSLEEPVEGLRVGLPREYLSEANDPAVNAAVRRAAEALEAAGATIVAVDLPLTEVGISTYYVIAPAEASSNLARFDGIRYGHRAAPVAGEDLAELYARSRGEGFGDEVKRRIMIGTYVLSSGYYDAYYRRALQVRRLIAEEFDRAFERCDVLLGPTAPTPAFPIGAQQDPLSMYLCDVYTVNADIAGICGISIPAGTTAVDGAALPLAVQLQAPAFAEGLLLRASRMLEQVMGTVGLAPAR